MRATPWLLVLLLAIQAVGPIVSQAQDVRRADEKLPPSLEGRTLLRPAERAAAGLDPYPHKSRAAAHDEATSATATSSDAPTSPSLGTRRPMPAVASQDRPSTPTMTREEIEARLKRNEAMALAAVRDPRVRQRAEMAVDRLHPGPWSPEYRRRLVEAEVRRFIQIGTDLKAVEDIEKHGEVLGRYVRINVTDVPVQRIVDEMSRYGVRVAVTPAMADKLVSLKLDNVRSDLAVKRLAIELETSLFELPEGSWVIGSDADVEASHPDARRIAPLAEPTPAPTPVNDP